MRSVFIHLRDTTADDVTAFLQRIYPGQPGPPWICSVDGDARLWINFYLDGSREFEPEDWANLVNALGCEPVASLIADVSGRYPGDDDVRAFISTTLGKFQGLAQDDYTNHFWTAHEVLSGHRVKGHVFFDYRGWFEEEHGIL